MIVAGRNPLARVPCAGEGLPSAQGTEKHVKSSYVERMPKYLASFGLVLAATALAGCSSSAPRSAVASAPTATTPSPSQAPTTDSSSSTDKSSLNCPSPSSAAGTPASGDDLRKYMPTCNDLAVPTGWVPGRNVVSGPGTDPLPPTMPDAKCDAIVGSSGFGLTEDYTATYAQDSVIPPPPFSGTVNVEAATYHPGDAGKLLAEVRDYAKRCPSLQGVVTSGFKFVGTDTVTVSANPLTGLGDEGIDLTATSSHTDGPSMEAMIIRFGDRILFVTYTIDSGTPPKLIDVATPLAKLMRG
jgi:hypothetical protein